MSNCPETSRAIKLLKRVPIHKHTTPSSLTTTVDGVNFNRIEFKNFVCFCLFVVVVLSDPYRSCPQGTDIYTSKGFSSAPTRDDGSTVTLTG